MKPNKKTDARSAGLVKDVQSYSNPADRLPDPRSHPTEPLPEPYSSGEPEVARGIGPDRLTPPEWFERWDEAPRRSTVNADEFPIVVGEMQVPDVSSAEEQISTTGVEALAYYAPFHFYSHNKWGIYIRDFGVATLASQFLGRNNLTAADNWVLHCAYEFLLQHEYSHFQAELAVSCYELLLLQNTIYLDHVYQRHFSDRHSSWLEESVANARGYQEFARRSQGTASQPEINRFKSFLANWMKSQPRGYRDYDQWAGRNGLSKGRLAITAHLHESLSKWRPCAIAGHSDILDLFKGAEYSEIPVTRIPDGRLPTLQSARHFPKYHGLQVIVFTNDHPPPHIHIDFLDSEPTVRVEWPSLQPLLHDRALSRNERRKLEHYLKQHQRSILHKLRTVFDRPSLPPAIE